VGRLGQDVACGGAAVHLPSVRVVGDPHCAGWTTTGCTAVTDITNDAQFRYHGQASGISVLRSPPSAPKANAYAERWVGMIRRECLDRILIFGERQLRHVLTEFGDHYNTHRPHRVLARCSPIDPGRIQQICLAGPVRRTQVLGGRSTNPSTLPDESRAEVLEPLTPDLVLQEIWGHLCCHYAIRSLMAQAATHSGHDPDRVSFVAALRITRQTLAQPGGFPPDYHGRDSPGGLLFLQRLLGRLNPARRKRSAPRVIKRKMPKWHVKRAHHASWPQPQHPPSYTIAAAN
jgi:Integrase core domain